MIADFCVATLHEALAIYGTPEIFNTDQDSHFTTDGFTKVLREAEVTISMDGVGRAIDNVFIERLWRTLKYDHIYLNPPRAGQPAGPALPTYLRYYNEERPHSSLNDRTPDEVYYGITRQPASRLNPLKPTCSLLNKALRLISAPSTSTRPALIAQTRS
jgi:putative transposase